MKSFWFHYNKPLSVKYGRNVLTIHWNKSCIPVYGITCNVPIKSKDRLEQPRCVMGGKASEVKIKNKHAIIS